MLTRFQVEDTGASIRLFPLAHLSFAVNIPYRFCERLQNIGSLPPKDIIHVMGRDDIRFASFQGACNTQQAYDIRVIGVEILTVPEISFQQKNNDHDRSWARSYRALVL